MPILLENWKFEGKIAGELLHVAAALRSIGTVTTARRRRTATVSPPRVQ